MFDRENNIFQCYFDITKHNDVAPDGDESPVVLDLDELSLALSEGVITQKEHDTYMAESHRLISALNKNRGAFFALLKNYFNLF